MLYPDELRISRSLAKSLRNRGYVATMNRAFAEVVEHCADRALRPEGTWITPQMKEAYLRLHELGYTHSVEIWAEGRLVGGLYGVALGRAFFGESMFSTSRDASKAALCALVASLRERGYLLIDCQVASEHLASLGARSVSRADFVRELAAATADPLVPDASWRDASIALTGPFVQNPRGPRGR